MIKHLANFDKKILALFLVCLSISTLTGFELINVFATPAPTRNTTVEPGSASTPCSFTGYVDGSTYLLRNCQTGINDYSGTNAWTVLQAGIDYLDAIAGGVGGKIFLQAAIYNLGTTGLTITGNAITLQGEGIQTRLDYSGTGACIQIGNDISDFYYDTIQDLRCNLTGGPSVGFLVMGNTYYGQLVRVRVSGSTTLSTGVEFKVTTTFITGWTIINPLIQAVKFGFKFDGSGPAGQGVTDTVVLSGFVNGQSQGVSGSTGIYVDRPDTLKVYGLSLNAFETMVNETTNANADEYHGLRLESCTTGFKLAGLNALIIGGSAPCTTPVTNTGIRNRIEALFGYLTSGRPVQTISFKSLVASVSTTSVPYVSTGFGVSFIPAASGNETITVTSTTIYDQGCDLSIYRNTGSIPSNGGAVTGSALIAGRSYTGASGQQQMSLTWYDTGLTLLTSYNYYVAFHSEGGATGCTVSGASAGTGTIILVTEIVT